MNLGDRLTTCKPQGPFDGNPRYKPPLRLGLYFECDHPVNFHSIIVLSRWIMNQARGLFFLNINRNIYYILWNGTAQVGVNLRKFLSEDT